MSDKSKEISVNHAIYTQHLNDFLPNLNTLARKLKALSVKLDRDFTTDNLDKLLQSLAAVKAFQASESANLRDLKIKMKADDLKSIVIEVNEKNALIRKQNVGKNTTGKIKAQY